MIPKTKVDIIAKIEDLQSQLEFLKGINTGCQHCQHFTGIGCRLAGDHLPPQHVLDAGCLSWEWNEVPF